MIPEKHRSLLHWFDARAGQLQSMTVLSTDMSLTRPTRLGVYVPPGWSCALSIRLSVKQGQSVHYFGIRNRNDSWAFFFDFSSGLDINEQSAMRNALLENLNGEVPIGVLRQVQADSGSGATYCVMGTGKVLRLLGNRVYISNVSPKNTYEFQLLMQSTMLTEIDAEYARSDADEFSFEEYEERIRVLRDVVARQGQGDFRNRLLKAYGARCAITESQTVEILEAAHIFPYRGSRTNSVKNGLILRSDLHTLFDLDMLGIEPGSHRLFFSSKVKDEELRSKQGSIMRLPAEIVHHPEPSLLRLRWSQFLEANPMER